MTDGEGKRSSPHVTCGCMPVLLCEGMKRVLSVKLFLHSYCRPSAFTHVRSCRGHSCGVSHLLPVLNRHAFLSTLR